MIIDGRKIARDILLKLESEVKQLPFKPVFCDVLVGSDPVSAQYVKMKAKMAERVGLRFKNANFPDSITTQQLVEEIKVINREPDICGLIIQLPLPQPLNAQEALNAIDPKIDVDCTGQANKQLFYEGRANLEFPTARAVIAILDSLKLDLKNKRFLVIGQGELVGRPVSFLLKQRGLLVEAADINTKNTSELMSKADVIISATGKAGLVSGNKIKKGAVVIDAGTSEAVHGGIVGDVDFLSVKHVAEFLSPVPGGVGPVTVAMLLSNVLRVAKNFSQY